MNEIFDQNWFWMVQGIMWGIALALIGYSLGIKVMRWYWTRKLHRHFDGVRYVSWRWGQMIIFAMTPAPKGASFKWPHRTLWYRMEEDEAPLVD